MNLNARQVPRQLANQPRQKKAVVLIQKMRDFMRDQHMKTGVQNDDLRHIAGGGVLVPDIFCVLPQTHTQSFFL